jgi:hypothetical protein
VGHVAAALPVNLSGFGLEQAMADFSELPVDTGVGDYHFNRFRIAFQPPAGRDAKALGQLLYTNFPTYIKSDAATAEWSDRKFEDSKTVHFHGFVYLPVYNPATGMAYNRDVAKPHSDWVAIEWLDPRTFSFTVQTLKREFVDAEEDTESAAGGGALGYVVGLLAPQVHPVQTVVGALLGATNAVDYNRMHFLAGRRAWRIGEGSVFGLPNNVMVLETVAVERLSAEPYRIADQTIGIEKRVPDVWLPFLNNFVNLNGLRPVDQILKPRWKKDSGAMYIQLAYDSLSGLRGDPEFLDADRLYSALLPYSLR